MPKGAAEAFFRGPLSVASWETLGEEIRCNEVRRELLNPDARGTFPADNPRLEAWEIPCLAGCNLLAGHCELLPDGGATALQKHAVAELRGLLERSGRLNERHRWGAKECREELKKCHTSYSGEEVEVAQVLTVEQMSPALPPRGFGGSIEATAFVSPGTASWLQNPRSLMKDPKEFVNHKFEAKVHVAKDELFEVGKLLVEREVCDWLEESKVFSYKGRQLFNGLFGVRKSGWTDGDKPILRTIMNLMPCNGLFLPLQYGHQGLVDIHCWGNLVLTGSDIVEISQSDMTSAFYLFKIPSAWQPFLSFRIKAKGKQINRDPSKSYYLTCKVLPMGWHSSVAIMQEISTNLLLQKPLLESHMVSKGKPMPSWLVCLTETVPAASRVWWQVYLDNFASGRVWNPYLDREMSEGEWQEFHVRAEEAWASAGIVSSSKKRVIRAEEATELGGHLDGRNHLFGGSPQRVYKTAKLLLYLLCYSFSVKELQTVVGRVIFLMSFRRPTMAALSRTWEYIVHPKRRARLLPAVRRELFNCLLLLPLMRQDLRAELAEEVTCSDASLKGGASAVARELTPEGRNFLAAAQASDSKPEKAKILVISLFNGIGGAFRAYDLLGIACEGLVYSEIDPSANRVTTRRWPGAENLGDVRSVTTEVIRKLAIRYSGISRVDVWSDFPCVDLSAAKYNRANLGGRHSSLIHEALRVLREVKTIFPFQTEVNFIFENVASMDVSARDQITELIGVKPWKLNPSDVLPISRPRFTWCSFPRRELPGLEWADRGGYFEVSCSGGQVLTEQWIRPEWSWPGESEGTVFATFMKSIPRRAPPPVPVGLARCNDDTIGRWTADGFRFPPYQYRSQFVLWRNERWRLLDSTERELLMGFGWGHTEVCWGANAVKTDIRGFEDTRLSLLGDSFAMLSFGVVLACGFNWKPGVFSVSHLVSRLGLAPGFGLSWEVAAPVRRALMYGLFACAPQQSCVRELNKVFLMRTDTTGADVRLLTGEFLGKKNPVRQSVPSGWWVWKFLFQNRWQITEHINGLEMRQAYNTLLWLLRDRKHFGLRWVHLSDSYVTISILSKGRTSSRRLEPLVRKCNAVFLLGQIYPVLLHVASLDNPTDEGSRSFSEGALATSSPPATGWPVAP